jgi:DMSO/TMAO reductase YedYZ molybdopterin-dependent catalytic subunit
MKSYKKTNKNKYLRSSLTTDHGAPVRIVTPQPYTLKGVKGIGEMEF